MLKCYTECYISDEMGEASEKRLGVGGSICLGWKTQRKDVTSTTFM